MFNIEGKDTINLFKKAFAVNVKLGMFLDDKMDEGLTIYNVDAQAVKVALQRKRWLMSFIIYGDFYGGIGLNIDDVYALSLKRKVGKNDSAEVGISLVDNKVLSAPPKFNFIVNLYAHKNLSHAKIYAQAGLRTLGNVFYLSSNSLTQKLAVLLGMQYKYAASGFTFTNTLEARYYGSAFNLEDNDTKLRYRKPATDIYEMYANTVGDYLYPLRKFNTPFSQWALYTEYHYSNVISVNFRGNISKALGQKTFVNLMYDLNYIRASDNFMSPYYDKPLSSFVCPFFTASLSYKIIKEVETSLLLTNQSMNLDVTYPTHYLLSHPRLGFKLVTYF